MVRRAWLLQFLAMAVSVAAASAGEPRDEAAFAREQRQIAETDARFAPEALARALLAETNRVRRAHWRRPLKPLPELNAAADDHAAFMALRMHVQHGSFLPGQANAAERVRRHGLEGVAVAENIAAASLDRALEEVSAAEIAAQLVAQWMDSPGHRANLLERRHTHFGGAVRLTRVIGGGWAAYGVQVFFVPKPKFGRVSS